MTTARETGGWPTTAEPGGGLAHLPRSEQPAADVVNLRNLRLVKASTVVPQETRWALAGLIPMRSMTLFAAREGVGKTMVACDWLARITRGELPGALSGDPQPVLIASSEDSLEATLRPRMAAAGADLDLTYFVQVHPWDDDKLDLGLNLAQDLEQLRAAAVATGARAMLVDPIGGALGSSDTHKDAEVRRVLAPLVKVIDDLDMAAILIAHLNKGAKGTDALSRVTGSRAFTAIVRSVLQVAPDPDDETQLRQMVFQSKNNLGPKIRSASIYETVSVEADGIGTARVQWVGERDLPDNINDILDGASDTDEDSPRDIWTCVLDYLREAHGGEALSKDLQAAVQAMGFNWRTAQRVMKRHGMTVTRAGFGPGATYVYRLTADMLDTCSSWSSGQ